MSTSSLPLPSAPARKKVYYPESDGKPLGETGVHIEVILELKSMPDAFFRNDSDVYVCADIMFYYVEGDPKKVMRVITQPGSRAAPQTADPSPDPGRTGQPARAHRRMPRSVPPDRRAVAAPEPMPTGSRSPG